MQKFDHNIGFEKKRQFFRRKLSKFAENCDHNIDPAEEGNATEFMCNGSCTKSYSVDSAK
jgi:hypothetical protein